MCLRRSSHLDVAVYVATAFKSSHLARVSEVVTNFTTSGALVLRLMPVVVPAVVSRAATLVSVLAVGVSFLALFSLFLCHVATWKAKRVSERTTKRCYSVAAVSLPPLPRDSPSVA